MDTTAPNKSTAIVSFYLNYEELKRSLAIETDK